MALDINQNYTIPWRFQTLKWTGPWEQGPNITQANIESSDKSVQMAFAVRSHNVGNQYFAGEFERIWFKSPFFHEAAQILSATIFLHACNFSDFKLVLQFQKLFQTSNQSCNFKTSSDFKPVLQFQNFFRLQTSLAISKLLKTSNQSCNFKTFSDFKPVLQFQNFFRLQTSLAISELF